MKILLTNKMIKTLVTSMCIATALLAAGGSYGGDNLTPDALIRTTSQEILDIIKTDTTADNQKIRQQVEARVMPLADFDRMTAFAIGRPWRTATAEQKAQLINEFRMLLARTYLSALTAYKSSTLSVKPARYSDKADAAVVRVEISTKNNSAPIPIDFALEKTSKGWKVFDVTVEGISFMTNHRNQFAPIIASQGIDGLLKQLNERNSTHANNGNIQSK